LPGIVALAALRLVLADIVPPDRQCLVVRCPAIGAEQPHAPDARADDPAWPGRDRHIPSRSAGPCRARRPSRSTACGTFFDKVPQLVELDHGRAARRRLRLGAAPLRMLAHPAQHALRRDADVLGHRVHRQTQAVELGCFRAAGLPRGVVRVNCRPRPCTASAVGRRRDPTGSAPCYGRPGRHRGARPSPSPPSTLAKACQIGPTLHG
jgi:hypothetical protein